MKVSLNWLNDHLDLAGKTTRELDDLLTFAGIEVEGIEERGGGLANVVVARVAASEPHPDADKLSVCRLEFGAADPIQVVCGAKNYAVGDKVPLALPGAELPNGMTIKTGKLRGVESNGMLCSAKELNLSSDHEGLMILPADAPLGAPVASLFKTDTIFELEITPNRPDGLSHLGVARELAVLTGQSLKGPLAHHDAGVAKKEAPDDQIRLDAPDGCPLYTARTIRGVRVGESPDWLKDKLSAIGLRPINNIVDITNYVLMEMGQPLHAFDLAKLKGGIVVRRATDGEAFLALDGEDYALTPDDLVIADHAQAVAIAGIMGGELSGVTETTTDILLESAYFDPPGIRRSARRLGLSSDSSYRFERGVDPHQVAGASALATKLILEIAGGTADDVLLVRGAAPTLTGTVVLDHQRCARLLGIEIPKKEVGGILTRLGLVCETASDDATSWKVPTWRADLQRHVDLVEEIARVYGLDRIPSSQTATFSDISESDREYDFLAALGTGLAARGFHEARTIKLISAAQLADHLCPLVPAEPVPLKNPLSDDHTHLRPGLVPGLLAVAARNVRMGADSLRFFETGTVFAKTRDGKVLERQHLGLLLAGLAAPRSWQNQKREHATPFTLRGALEALVPEGLALTFVPVAPTPELVLAVEIKIGKQKIGLAGQLWPARARALDLDCPVLVAEIDLARLRAAIEGRSTRFVELPKFPAVTRDVAVEVPYALASQEIEDFLRAAGEPLLREFSLFDVFTDPTGQRLPADKKSLAYTLTYRHELKTLESSEVDAAHGRILGALQKALPARLR